MPTETEINAKDPGEGSGGSEATQTGGSATAREKSNVADLPNTYSTAASDAEADVESVRDASTDGNQPGEVEGVRSGE